MVYYLLLMTYIYHPGNPKVLAHWWFITDLSSMGKWVINRGRGINYTLTNPLWIKFSEKVAPVFGNFTTSNDVFMLRGTVRSKCRIISRIITTISRIKKLTSGTETESHCNRLCFSKEKFRFSKNMLICLLVKS